MKKVFYHLTFAKMTRSTCKLDAYKMQILLLTKLKLLEKLNLFIKNHCKSLSIIIKSNIFLII